VVPSSPASIGPVTVSMVATGGTYPKSVPRTWAIAMTILILCLLASIVIALVKLI